MKTLKEIKSDFNADVKKFPEPMSNMEQVCSYYFSAGYQKGYSDRMDEEIAELKKQKAK